MYKSDTVRAAYAAYSKNENKMISSSSGAIFPILAEYVLMLHGVVYGVTMTDDCKGAEYIRVDSINKLEVLRGSKYIQAKIGDTFRKVREDLVSGKFVLFTGTGCQINGLLAFLDREFENLWCVDVVCHGVPSPKLWSRYISYIEKNRNSRVISVDFRCKDTKWKDVGVRRVNSKKHQLYIPKGKDPYMQMFLKDYSLRPSCYACVAKNNRKSDLSIADFWGVEKFLSEMNYKNRVSLVLIRTEKGQKFFKENEQFFVMNEVSYPEAVLENPAEYLSAKMPEQRKDFFKDLNSMPFKQFLNKYHPISNKRRIKEFILKSFLGWYFIGKYIKENVNGKSEGLLFTLTKE